MTGPGAIGYTSIKWDAYKPNLDVIEVFAERCAHERRNPAISRALHRIGKFRVIGHSGFTLDTVRYQTQDFEHHDRSNV